MVAVNCARVVPLYVPIKMGLNGCSSQELQSRQGGRYGAAGHGERAAKQTSEQHYNGIGSTRGQSESGHEEVEEEASKGLVLLCTYCCSFEKPDAELREKESRQFEEWARPSPRGKFDKGGKRNYLLFGRVNVEWPFLLLAVVRPFLGLLVEGRRLAGQSASLKPHMDAINWFSLGQTMSSRT